jgi:hypothetical protein
MKKKMNSIEKLIDQFRKSMNDHYYDFGKAYLVHFNRDLEDARRQYKNEITEAYCQGMIAGNNKEVQDCNFRELEIIVNATNNYYRNNIEQ